MPNNSFKPTLLRGSFGVVRSRYHAASAAAQRGLTQVLALTARSGSFMQHSELNELWRKQRRNDQDWHRQLVGSAITLRNSVRELLKPDPSTWQDFNTKAKNEYVEIVDFYGLDKPIRGDVRNLDADPSGVLVYGIAVTFDNGPDSYPKQDIYIPVASRLMGNAPEYALFDRDKDSPDNNWHSDSAAFSRKLIERLKEYLSHNAFDGFEKRQTFGFIR